MYNEKEEEEDWLSSIENSVDTSIQRPEDYTGKHDRELITTTWNNTDNAKINRTTISKKWKREENNPMDVLNGK